MDLNAAHLNPALYESGRSTTMKLLYAAVCTSVADPWSTDWESGRVLEELADGEHMTLVPAAARGQGTNSIHKRHQRTAVGASRPLLASPPGQQHPPALFTAWQDSWLLQARAELAQRASSWFT